MVDVGSLLTLIRCFSRRSPRSLPRCNIGWAIAHLTSFAEPRLIHFHSPPFRYRRPMINSSHTDAEGNASRKTVGHFCAIPSCQRGPVQKDHALHDSARLKPFASHAT